MDFLAVNPPPFYSSTLESLFKQEEEDKLSKLSSSSSSSSSSSLSTKTTNSLRPSQLFFKSIESHQSDDFSSYKLFPSSPSSPTVDSGYSTVAKNTPEFETPPTTSLSSSDSSDNEVFDFEKLLEQLKPLSVSTPTKTTEKEDEKCSTSSLASLSYSDSFITPPPPDQIQYVGQEVNFWISFELKKSYLYCCIRGPSSGLVTYPTANPELDLGQVKMSFTPIQHGRHSIEVMTKKEPTSSTTVDNDVDDKWKQQNSKLIIGGFKNIKKEDDNEHLIGSPISITVCRNYAYAAFGHPIISIDMESLGDEYVTDLSIERKPWGITTNKAKEQIIVTDREQHLVISYGPDGTRLFSFGGFGTRTGLFRRPTGIVYDSVLDRLYVTDKDNHRVQVFSSTGDFIFAFGSRGRCNGQFSFPWGIAVSKCGQMIVIADSRNHRVQLFSSDGQFIRKYVNGYGGHGQLLDYPRGVTFDSTGNYIYASDFNLHHIIRLDINFTNPTIIVDNTHLKRPQGLHIDSTGQLLVSNSRQNSVKVFNSINGDFLYEITSIHNFELDLPLNVTTLHGGFLAILDLNGRISVF